jgi:uncharacterized protein YidB (DUF937 family)
LRPGIDHKENNMGLRDILIGMQNGPRGQRPPSAPGGGGGGMSPLTMALLALLAYKGIKGMSGGRGAAASEPRGGTPLPRSGTGGPTGGLGDILGGLLGGRARTAPAGGKPGGSLADLLPPGLGGLLGGAAAGSVLSGGLGNVLKDLQQSGQGHVASSWVGPGPNEEIAPDQLEQAFGSDTLDALAQHSGMSRDELLTGLSQNLPDLIDRLTPQGRLPTEQEASRMV